MLPLTWCTGRVRVMCRAGAANAERVPAIVARPARPAPVPLINKRRDNDWLRFSFKATLLLLTFRLPMPTFGGVTIAPFLKCCQRIHLKCDKPFQRIPPGTGPYPCGRRRRD